MELNSTVKTLFNQNTRIVVLPAEVPGTQTSFNNKITPAHDESAVAPSKAFQEISRSITVPDNSKLMFPDQQYNDDFLRTMSTVVRWSRWCGALSGGGSRATRFWSCCLIALLGVIIVSVFERLFKDLAVWTFRNKDTGAVSIKMAGLMFYLNALGTVALTWRLGSVWRLLAARWAASDRALAAHVPLSKTLRRDMLAMLAVVCIGSFVEHVLSLASAVGTNCSSDVLRCYTLASHGFFLREEHYTWWWGVFILAVSNVATVLWNLQDLIIMLLSTGLSSRYRRLNTFAANIVQRCEQHSITESGSHSHHSTAPPQQLWRAAREGFARQAALVRLVDEALGPLVLLSFLNNFYFICYQMYNGISSVEGALQRSYFIISFFWLCARAAGVVLAASAVHLHSRSALTHTHACPSHYYTVEVHRLQTQLSKDQIALSGMHFFEITRSFLLKVAGAIVTYEIVLVQFNENVCN